MKGKKKGIAMEAEIARLQQMIDESQYIVFFGGAGVSTESGIPDFRSQDGLYHQHYAYPPETILSHRFYLNNKEEFFRFYRDSVLHPAAKPNAAHLKLAELERAGKLKAVITQNIDGLHQQAASQEVIELHGSILRNRCENCGRAHTLAEVLGSQGVPHCSCGGDIKPCVVLYEEGLDRTDMARAIGHIQKADLLIIGGTSLAVYPAAGLIDSFSGRHLVLINKGETGRGTGADLVIRAAIGEVLSGITV